jgi:hypothetical protein
LPIFVFFSIFRILKRVPFHQGQSLFGKRNIPCKNHSQAHSTGEKRNIAGKKRPPYEEENKDCRFFRLGVEEIAVDESGAFGRTEAR